MIWWNVLYEFPKNTDFHFTTSGGWNFVSFDILSGHLDYLFLPLDFLFLSLFWSSDLFWWVVILICYSLLHSLFPIYFVCFLTVILLSSFRSGWLLLELTFVRGKFLYLTDLPNVLFWVTRQQIFFIRNGLLCVYWLLFFYLFQ